MIKKIKTDLCVIGAGSGGLSVAAGASQLGAKVVLLERGEMGGDCLNYGCVPSKALLAVGNIVKERGRFLTNGSLFRGEKPVMWSPVERTALAEAEIEYHEHKSTQIWVKFPIIKSEISSLKRANAVIWTTTPWTIPGNRAVAYGEGLNYVVCEIKEITENSFLKLGERLLVAEALLDAVTEKCGVTRTSIVTEIEGLNWWPMATEIQGLTSYL